MDHHDDGRDGLPEAISRAMVTIAAGQGIHVPPGVAHRFVDRTEQLVEFLVVSSPPTGSDRAQVDRTA